MTCILPTFQDNSPSFHEDSNKDVREWWLMQIAIFPSRWIYSLHWSILFRVCYFIILLNKIKTGSVVHGISSSSSVCFENKADALLWGLSVSCCGSLTKHWGHSLGRRLPPIPGSACAFTNEQLKASWVTVYFCSESALRTIRSYIEIQTAHWHQAAHPI